MKQEDNALIDLPQRNHFGAMSNTPTPGRIKRTHKQDIPNCHHGQEQVANRCQRRSVKAFADVQKSSSQSVP